MRESLATGIVFSVVFLSLSNADATEILPNRGLREVSHERVELRGGFWGRRQKVYHETTIPHALDRLERNGHVTNFDKAAGVFDGPLRGHHAFDSDVHKAMEGAMVSLQHHNDPQLRVRVEGILDRILAAQQQDGYLISYFIVNGLDKLWQDVVGRKMYVNGAVGTAQYGDEGFGDPYLLPNRTYCESCAGIAHVLWQQRMNLLKGQAKYADVMELSLYNGAISGISISGDGFFYQNPLESNGSSRSAWIGLACCPTNLTRIIPQVGGLVYAQAKNRLYVNLFAAGDVSVRMDDGVKVKLAQETNYPWDGYVKLTVTPEQASDFDLCLRIPGWAIGRPVPSDLYRFADSKVAAVGLKVNGKRIDVTPEEDGYVHLKRSWQAADTVELDLPMPIRRVYAHEKVLADKGKVSLKRGPITYCIEAVDNPNVDVLSVVLPREAELHAEHRERLLGGVTVLQGKGLDDRKGPVTLTAVPYYSWANREKGAMTIWINEASATPPKRVGKSSIKVFILAGQSNMQGQGVVAMDHPRDYNGGKGNLEYVMKNSPLASMYTHLKDARGQWTVRDDVWVHYKTERRGLLAGALTIGFTGYGNSTHIGPELQFGHVVGDYLDNRVLLIKTAWGGKSLYKDFRPPSSGVQVGPYYTRMLQEVKEALDKLKQDFPAHDGTYELAGFVWLQGWNDMVDPLAVDEYEANLVNLIKDVRTAWKVPNLPVVIGELGNGGPDAGQKMHAIREAQAAATAYAEFKGTVTFVSTTDFARPAAESPNTGHGHHWFGNAESYFLIGNALGKGMVRLLAGQNLAQIPMKSSVPSQATGKNKAWTDPKAASREDPDFLIQGEYGSVKTGGAVGVQVVARGQGKFDAYLLQDGLPGLGWTREKRRTVLKGTRDGNTVTFSSTGKKTAAMIRDGKFLIAGQDPEAVSLPRIERRSPTLAAKPPKGAQVLFDGSSAEHWENGKVANGHLLATGCTTKNRFTDYTLHLEFRTPYMPHARGQGRGNSGVYHSGRWETQILDSFGLDGRDNECGGIYSISKPRLNMCLPPLAWQTYDVDFTAAKFDADGGRIAWPRITVKLNGVLVHKDLELAKDFTTSAPITNPLRHPRGPIYIQNHNNPVVFRNIWVTTQAVK